MAMGKIRQGIVHSTRLYSVGDIVQYEGMPDYGYRIIGIKYSQLYKAHRYIIESYVYDCGGAACPEDPLLYVSDNDLRLIVRNEDN